MDSKQKLHQENICSKILSIQKSVPANFQLKEICVGNIEYIGFSRCNNFFVIAATDLAIFKRI